MDSILGLAKTEGMLFKYGSGTGSNLSSIRGSHEGLSAGGTASGPLSFMKGFDSFAGAIKSGGKTRRAAKMVILNIDHPDIEDFILSKANEEKKAWALIDAGYDGSFNGEAYASIFYQNANHSVRVTDEFMEAVEKDGEWQTKEVLTGQPFKTYRARDLMAKIADSAWICGDPGMQYDTTINKWNPVKATHRINASNPCSEYMFVDDSACNLASLNLMKFFNAEDGSFDVDDLPPRVRRRHHRAGDARRQLLVPDAGDRGELPQVPAARPRLREPRRAAHGDRPSVRLRRGPRLRRRRSRRSCAARRTCSPRRSPRSSGPSPATRPTATRSSRSSACTATPRTRSRPSGVPAELHKAQMAVWDAALESGKQYGYKNGQVTVLAPTGTIGFMMDCDTTGVEPDLALVKYKKLVGGGTIKIVNQTVPARAEAPRLLDGGGPRDRRVRRREGDDRGRARLQARAPARLRLRVPRVERHALDPLLGPRPDDGAPSQPFLSGAISKTVNLPPDATPDEIAGVYMDGWKQGLKAIAIYRDGCKRTQPLNTAASKSDTKSPTARGSLEYVGKAAAPVPAPFRRKLPDERRSITHKFYVAGHEGYITVGLYEDGKPGEIFLTMSKEGSTISGLMDSFATAISLTLQYGVPLEALVNKFTHMRFEPAGFTKNPEIPIAKSLVDYIFRWLGSKFLTAEEKQAIGIIARDTSSHEPDARQPAGRRDAELRGRRTSSRSRRPRTRPRATSAGRSWSGARPATSA